MAQMEIGDDIMLFDDKGKSLAFGKSHTLSIGVETQQISHKDSGVYGSKKATKVNWSISAEHMYSEGAYDTLFDKMVALEPITVYFGKKKSEGDKTVADDPTLTAWSANNPPQSTLRTGQVIITKLDLQAQSGDNATFSVEFEGVGKISQAKTIPA